MEEICEKIVRNLEKQNKTISFMESCTGGFLANCITNISGASNVLKVSLVTYSTAYKEKFGVDKNIIDNYTVYSMETAKEMAKNVSKFADSSIGVGITGELGNTINNKSKVYYSIYSKEKNECLGRIIIPISAERVQMKKEVAESIFLDILKCL